MPSIDEIWAEMKADAKPERKAPSSRAGDLGKLSQKSGMATSMTSKVVETAELKETVMNVNSIPGEFLAAAAQCTNNPVLHSRVCAFLRLPDSRQLSVAMFRLLAAKGHRPTARCVILFHCDRGEMHAMRATTQNPSHLCVDDELHGRRRARGDERFDCCQDERRRQ